MNLLSSSPQTHIMKRLKNRVGENIDVDFDIDFNDTKRLNQTRDMNMHPNELNKHYSIRYLRNSMLDVGEQHNTSVLAVGNMGGVTIVSDRYDSATDQVAVAFAVCSKSDNFDKRIGRELALERLEEFKRTGTPTTHSFMIDVDDIEYLVERCEMLGTGMMTGMKNPTYLQFARTALTQAQTSFGRLADVYSRWSDKQSD